MNRRHLFAMLSGVPLLPGVLSEPRIRWGPQHYMRVENELPIGCYVVPDYADQTWTSDQMSILTDKGFSFVPSHNVWSRPFDA